ncbi:MAG TPA: hypothetical protein VKY82_08855 [Flavobacterium sp.]|nr:hypothetical protein [Flavobacterium sp.]
MKVYLSMLLFFILNLGFSQQIPEFECILNVDKLPFSKSEIRVYKDHSISTGLELFRIYYDEDKKDWNAEFYQTVAKELKDKTIEVKIRRYDLKSYYNIEYIALQLLFSDIKYLPSDDVIKYKMEPKAKILLEEEGFIIETTSSITTDGIHYYVQVADLNEFYEIKYSNPENYLKKHPTIDELISFNEFLDIIKQHFNIFEDYKKRHP